MSGSGKAWKDRAFFYGISIGCIPPKTKGEILAHKGSQTTGATPGGCPAPWNHTLVVQRTGKTGPPQKNSKILLTGVHIDICTIYNRNIKRWTKREYKYYRSSGIFSSTVLKLNIQNMWILSFAYLVYTLFLSKQCDALSSGNCQ